MRHERGSVEVDDAVPSISAREAVSVQSNDAGPAVSNKAAIRSLFKSLEQKGVRYCHWKSNIRLEETLAAAEDIDLLVDRRDASFFYAALLENGLKLTQSRSGIGHPGVFHAVGLDEASAASVHVHAYFQIVSGDSLVKSYRLLLSPWLGSACRFTPTCSAYSLQALERHGAAGGTYLTKTDPDGEHPYGIEDGGVIIHEIGTARMGPDPKTSVLNGYCQAHEVKNLFVTDGASFVSNPDKNPTLTILALSWRASDYLLQQAKRGNL